VINVVSAAKHAGHRRQRPCRWLASKTLPRSALIQETAMRGPLPRLENRH